MHNFFARAITIYNDIPADAVNPRRFDRYVNKKCNVQGGIVSKADGTIENIVNGTTVYIRDVENYLSPLEYAALPADQKDDYFTMQIGDFVVLDEVDDVVTSGREFAELQQKYAQNGLVVRSVSVNIHGMDVDNITITNVG